MDLEELFLSGDYVSVIAATEPRSRQPNIEDYILNCFILLAALLANDDVLRARLLWKRLPESLKEHPDLKALADASFLLFRARYHEFFLTLKNYAWSWPTIICGLYDSRRRHLLKSISHAYSTVSIEFLKQMVPDLEELHIPPNWALDPSSKYYTIPVDTSHSVDIPGLEAFDTLSDILVHFENE